MSVKKLDPTDIKLLAILQQDGRITKTALADRVNLSPTPCWERLKRLEEQGFIESYHARLNFRALGIHATILTEIVLTKHTRDGFLEFETAILGYPQITDCWATGGGIDYIMKFATRSVESYQALMDQLLAARIGIDRYYTYIVTKPVKESLGYPAEFIE